MRPIRLVMQAFGPYAEVQVLEMDRLGRTGIYAITGETGAGKTTIFDAIVYALYGCGSGEDRGDGKRFRAAAARPELETRVEMEFESRGRRYIVERRPAQPAPGRRSAAPVEKPASQKLIMPDGKTVYTKKGDIDALIRDDILGVDREQFCQIVMIAQGEFRKLLQADTKDRTEIMRRIFRTQRYDRLKDRMEQACREQGARLEESRRQVLFALKAMRAKPDCELAGALADMQAVEVRALLPDEAATLAMRICRADDDEYREARAALTDAEAARERAKQAYEQARAAADKRKRLAILTGEMDKQRRAQEEAARRLADAEAEKGRIGRLAQEIAAIERLLPKYGQLGGLESRRARSESGIAGADADLMRAGAIKSSLTEEREKLQNEAEALSDAAERRLRAFEALNRSRERGRALDALEDRMRARDAALAALKEKTSAAGDAAEAEAAAAKKLNALTAERDALGNTALKLNQKESECRALIETAQALEALRGLFGKYGAAQAACAEAQRRYGEAEAAAVALRGEAESARRRYNADIAGVWAQALADGEPCPVCGSTHHPHKAVMATAPVTQTEVEQAEAKAAQAEKAFNGQALECRDRRGDCEGIRQQLAEKLSECPEETWSAEIDRRERENREALQAVEAEIGLAKKAHARFVQLREDLIPGAQREKDLAAEAYGDAAAAVKAAETARTGAQQEVDRAAKAIMPAEWTALDLSDAAAEARKRIGEAEAALDRAEAEAARLHEIGERQKALAEALEAATGDAHEAERRLSSLRTELHELERQIEEMKKELPFAAEADCRAAIDAKTKEREALENAIAAAQRDAAKLSEVIAGTKGQITALEADLQNAPEADPEALKAAYAEQSALWETAAGREKAVHSRRENNAERGRQLKDQAEAARGLEKQYRMMQDVCDTVKGNISGMHIPLETFVQTACFDRIIAYANRRLIHMSRRQYDLARQSTGDSSGKGKTGLELDVVDHANGQRRAVGTLSGGESFLAALSFALGMSDAIQAGAVSAVQLDTMFVDEGFGSLSESFLNLVMDELNDTANTGRRLIGVISHVDEVKEGIERRIEVTKSAGGVSRAEIR